MFFHMSYLDFNKLSVQDTSRQFQCRACVGNCRRYAVASRSVCTNSILNVPLAGESGFQRNGFTSFFQPVARGDNNGRVSYLQMCREKLACFHDPIIQTHSLPKLVELLFLRHVTFPRYCPSLDVQTVMKPSSCRSCIESVHFFPFAFQQKSDIALKRNVGSDIWQLLLLLL